MTTPPIVQDLKRPEAYPWQPDEVVVIETHISWVFLAGDRVVKIKRPVHLPFVDQSSVAARRRLCEDEVRLNERLTDGVYLGVVPVTYEGDRHVLDGAGTPVDWATVMRRLPHDRMLDTLIATGTMPQDTISRLAGRLIAFHRNAGPCTGSSVQQADDAVGVLVDNLDELAPLMRHHPFGTELAMIDEAARAYLGNHRDLFDQRAADGWVRDGHGDLRAEHICLERDGPVQIFDCVEFSRSFRCADVASDLAFLLMDLDRLGVEPSETDRLVTWYREAGLSLPPELLALYRIHRALVRVKVDAIRMADADDDDDDQLLGDIAAYLHTVARHAITCDPVALVMSGLSGTGKSTVARQLAGVLGADHHRSDLVRKEMTGTEGGATAEFGEGIYREDTTAATYERLIALGATSLRSGKPVILDATFLDSAWRRAAAVMAGDLGVPMLVVETVTDEAVLERRLEARTARGGDPSDADITIMRRQRERLQEHPVDIPDGALQALIDTTPEGYVDLDPALDVLRNAGLITVRLADIGAS
jgi:uncharacterized protein